VVAPTRSATSVPPASRTQVAALAPPVPPALAPRPTTPRKSERKKDAPSLVRSVWPASP
jgi:hypothetical protein